MLRYVEHTGAAIGAGAADLKDIEERMEILGMQPLLRRTSSSTATGVAIDDKRISSEIIAWIMATELFLTDLFNMAASWLNITLPDNFKVDIFSDLGLSVRATDDINALIQSRRAGEISRETFLREVKRRGLLDESVDIEHEIEAINAEGPSLSDVGTSPDANAGGSGA